LTIDRELTLGIETSGFGGSVALVRSGVVIASRDLDPTGRRHARTLVPEIQSLLREAGRTALELQLIAVSIGPGSFTGLRVGVVCAKTLAWAVGAKVLAVDTFLATAAQSPPAVAAVQVVGDGQRGDLYIGRYHRQDNGDWTRDGDIAIRPAEDWLAQLTTEDVVTGPALERHASAIRCRVLPLELRQPLASTVALLGERRLTITGTSDDLWLLEPFYLRKSGAEEKAEMANG
jgi:tRNA threonylcarbamoyladenosine biosynthesis protein TsaB